MARHPFQSTQPAAGLKPHEGRLTDTDAGSNARHHQDQLVDQFIIDDGESGAVSAGTDVVLMAMRNVDRLVGRDAVVVRFEDGGEIAQAGFMSTVCPMMRIALPASWELPPPTERYRRSYLQ
jgi:hypothetical protein